MIASVPPGRRRAHVFEERRQVSRRKSAGMRAHEEGMRHRLWHMATTGRAKFGRAGGQAAGGDRLAKRVSMSAILSKKTVTRIAISVAYVR